MEIKVEEAEQSGAAAAPEEKSRRRWQGLSGGTLKMIAVFTMLLDHIGAAVVMRVLSSRGFMDIVYSSDAGAVSAWLGTGNNYNLYLFYMVLRQIGRTAFPIYCFMLVEGLQRTRNVWKYAMRLGIFALVSEIPFDLAFNGTMLEFNYQNVFFTLVIGLLTMIVLDKIAGRTWGGGSRSADVAIKVALTILVSAAGIGLAELLRTDYAGMGIACILVMYFLRRKRWLQLLAGYIAFLVIVGEFFAFPAFLFLAFYRGKKGISMKYFFYGFYPVHLLLLYLTCVLMGIAGYPAL